LGGKLKVRRVDTLVVRLSLKILPYKARYYTAPVQTLYCERALGRITFRASGYREGVGGDDRVKQGGVGVEEGGRAQAVVQLEGGADEE
jgi:hypothetical protein